MRTILSALLSLVLSFVFSANVLANTFAGGIPKQVPYTYDGITYDRYVVFNGSNDHWPCSQISAVYFVSSEMSAAEYPAGYYYSLGLYTYGESTFSPAFSLGPPGTHFALFHPADNFQGECVWPIDSIPDEAGELYWWDLLWTPLPLALDPSKAIYDHNFDLYTRSLVRRDPLLPYTFTDEYTSWGTWHEGKYQGDSSFGFPIPKDKNGNPFTAYTASISSIMDQSTLGTGTPYDDSDHQVVSFEGEVGDQGPYTGSTCYAKTNGKAFGKNINYKGTSGTGGKYYLCYNGHPGYDYPFAKKTPIHAATAGTLCVATNRTTPDGSLLWRNPDRCPFSKAGGTIWKDYHTFYILHEGLLFNGSVNSYMTVYLHSNNLEASVQQEIIEYGYARATDNLHVADVGGYGPSGPDTYGNHLHFEVYKWNTTTFNWDRIDPYGDGVNNVLWRR